MPALDGEPAGKKPAGFPIWGLFQKAFRREKRKGAPGFGKKRGRGWIFTKKDIIRIA